MLMDKGARTKLISSGHLPCCGENMTMAEEADRRAGSAGGGTLIYADTDFCLALMKESDWLKECRSIITRFREPAIIGQDLRDDSSGRP